MGKNCIKCDWQKPKNADTDKFKPQQQLEEAFRKGDLIRLRQAVQTYLRQDPGNITGLPVQAPAWAEEREPKLFEAHDSDNEPMEAREEVWSSQYWINQKAALTFNFSRERIAHLIAVGAKLQAEGNGDFQPMPGLVSFSKEAIHPETPGRNPLLERIEICFLVVLVAVFIVIVFHPIRIFP